MSLEFTEILNLNNKTFF